MSDEIFLQAGQPDYELARAMWRQRHRATAKSFDRVSVGLRRILVSEAREIIDLLEEADHVVMHEDNVDGG